MAHFSNLWAYPIRRQLLIWIWKFRHNGPQYVVKTADITQRKSVPFFLANSMSLAILSSMIRWLILVTCLDGIKIEKPFLTWVLTFPLDHTHHSMDPWWGLMLTQLKTSWAAMKAASRTALQYTNHVRPLLHHLEFGINLYNLQLHIVNPCS